MTPSSRLKNRQTSSFKKGPSSAGRPADRASDRDRNVRREVAVNVHRARRRLAPRPESHCRASLADHRLEVGDLRCSKGFSEGPAQSRVIRGVHVVDHGRHGLHLGQQVCRGRTVSRRSDCFMSPGRLPDVLETRECPGVVLLEVVGGRLVTEPLVDGQRVALHHSRLRMGCSRPFFADHSIRLRASARRAATRAQVYGKASPARVLVS